MLPSRSLRVGIIVLGLTGISSSLAFSACADFDGEESPDASSSSSSSGGSGSSTSSASSSSSSGTIPDAPPDGVSSDGGATSSSGTAPGPATLRCGSFYCDTSKNEVCCNAYDAGGTCVPLDVCFAVEGRFRCDNNRDCVPDAGGICCLRAPGPNAYSECAIGNCGQVNVPLCEIKEQCPLAQDECIDPAPLLPNGYKICKGP